MSPEEKQALREKLCNDAVEMKVILTRLMVDLHDAFSKAEQLATDCIALCSEDQ